MKYNQHVRLYGLLLLFTSSLLTAGEMGTVQVFGSKTHQTYESPAPLIVISAEDISNSHSQNLGDLLDSLPGIHMQSLFGSNSSNNVIDLGGFGAAASRNTLILLNGQRLNDVDIAAIDISIISTDLIEQIEITSGSGSILYGNGAAGGAINIITKSEIPDMKQLTLVSSSDRQLEEAELLLSGNTSNASSILSIRSSEAEGFRANNEYRQNSIGLNATSKISDRNKLSFKAIYNNTDQNLPGARRVDIASGIHELKYQPEQATTTNDYIDNEGIYLQLENRFIISDQHSLSAQAGFRNKHQSGFTDFGSGFSGYLENNLNTWSFSGHDTLLLDAFSSTHEIIMGVDAYRTQYDSDRSHTERTISLPIHQLTIDQKLTAWFIQDSSEITKNVITTFGARRERITTEAADLYNVTAPAPPFAFDAQASPFRISEEETVYAAGLRVLLSEQTSFFANLEQSLRFGTVDEFFELDPNTFTSSLDPLKPQTGVNREAGIETRMDKFKIIVSSFNNKFKNEIHFDSATFENLNLQDTRHKGSKLSLLYDITNSITINFNSSYTRATFEEGPYSGNSIPLVARQAHNASINWAKSNRLSFFANGRHTGKKYFDNDQANSFGRIPSYTTVDAGGKFTEKNITIAFKLYNILDEKAFDYGVKSTFSPGVYNAYPLAERYLQLKLTFDW